jgi:hypothetical protein
MDSPTKVSPNKNGLYFSIKAFIKDSRLNIETKTLSINSILRTMKEENEILILKGNLYFLTFMISNKFF